MARRLGIMYIIWNKKIWGTYSASSGWRPYSCSGVTGCHQNHVHFSFSKAGASGKTSYWTKVVVNVGGSPGNGDNHGGGSSGGSAGSGGSGGSGGGSTGGSGTPTSHGGDGDGWTHDGPPSLSDSTLPVQIAVPTDDDVVTPYALQAGHHYLVSVGGSYTYGSVRTSWDGDRTPLVADAECLQQPHWGSTGSTTTWTTTPQFGGSYNDVLLDLSVDSLTSWTPTTDDGNGCNPTDHRYVLHLTPAHTMPLYLHVVGGDRVGSAGTLSVTVSRDGS
jgi:hypothetical protein